MDKVLNWTQANKINVGKSKYVVIGTPQMLNRVGQGEVPTRIGNIPLDCVLQYEYLGIIIDEGLCFEKALKKVYTKLNHNLYLLGLIRKYLTKHSAIQLLKSLAMPYMEYAYYERI